MSTQTQIDAIWQCLTRLEGEIEILQRRYNDAIEGTIHRMAVRQHEKSRALEERIRALEKMHKLR